MNLHSINVLKMGAFAYSDKFRNEAGVDGKLFQEEKDVQSIISIAYENSCCDRNTFNVLF